MNSSLKTEKTTMEKLLCSLARLLDDGCVNNFADNSFLIAPDLSTGPQGWQRGLCYVTNSHFKK